jgi:hypothetical protein
MRERNSNRVVLNGGLGNQLFQIASGLYYSKNNTILADGNLGLPNLNSHKRAILESLDFSGKEISFTNPKKRHLQRNSFGCWYEIYLKSKFGFSC